MWNYSVREVKLTNVHKRVKKDYVNYGTLLEETICTLLESQMERRAKKEQNDYSRKQCPRTS